VAKDVPAGMQRVERLAANGPEQARMWSDASAILEGISRHLHNPIFRAELWCVILEFERLQ
jgi:hypothetical protein